MSDVSEFTPIEAIVGGAILGAASLLLLFFTGRIAGISGIFGGLLYFKRGDTAWRSAFVAGLLAGGMLLAMFYPRAFNLDLDYSVAAVVLAGLLVGFGTRMSNGCTSGHGICGVGRLSPRSIVAVVVFLIAGMISATLAATVFMDLV